MTIEILGGSLTPVVHDGSSVDAVYGVAADGSYLGVVPAADAFTAATTPPPAMGTWRWSAGTWQAYIPLSLRSLAIEQQRDDTIRAGVSWNGSTWYADEMFQQQLASYLVAWSEGVWGPTATANVRSMDKVVHALTRTEVRALFGAVIAVVDEAYESSWTAKAALGT